MKAQNSQTFVISLGGSLLSLDSGPNVEYVSRLTVFLKKYIKKGHRFILITGGGNLARQYQNALKNLGAKDSTTLDLIGISATKINAEFLKLSLKNLAHAKIVEDPNKKQKFSESILVSGGWRPGCSSDDGAVRLAKAYGSKIIINLSNIDFLYTKDPNKFPDAQKIEKISWQDYLPICGKKWTPGSHVPFDPVASQNAQSFKIKVVIANGQDFENLDKILTAKDFLGTVIG